MASTQDGAPLAFEPCVPWQSVYDPTGNCFHLGGESNTPFAVLKLHKAVMCLQQARERDSSPDPKSLGYARALANQLLEMCVVFRDPERDMSGYVQPCLTLRQIGGLTEDAVSHRPTVCPPMMRAAYEIHYAVDLFSLALKEIRVPRTALVDMSERLGRQLLEMLDEYEAQPHRWLQASTEAK